MSTILMQRGDMEIHETNRDGAALVVFTGRSGPQLEGAVMYLTEEQAAALATALGQWVARKSREVTHGN